MPRDNSGKWCLVYVSWLERAKFLIRAIAAGAGSFHVECPRLKFKVRLFSSWSLENSQGVTTCMQVSRDVLPKVG